MKIGIVTSGNDMLSIFKFLNRYDHEYVIYYDFLNRPYGDKPFEYNLEEIKKGIGLLTKKGCEKIILPPIYELKMVSLDKGKGPLQGRDLILPLFTTYLHDSCFSNSLIGKLGIFGDYADIHIAQKLIQQEEKKYKLTDNQKNIKKFNFPFKYRTKETTLWKYYLTGLSYSDPMINKVIKHDMRYFKDAMVDTAIPLNYGYFHYQNTLSKFFNYKKTRFHKLEKVEDSFNKLDIPVSKKYAINIYYTGHYDFLLREKRLLRLLARGKEIKVKFEEVK